MDKGVFFLALGAIALVIYIATIPLQEKRKFRRYMLRRQKANYEAEMSLHTSEQFWQTYHKHMPDNTVVDDITWNDLSMDSIFLELNYCQSVLGDCWLYHSLRHPLRGQQDVPDRRPLQDAFAEDSQLAMDIQYILYKMGRKNTAGLESVIFTPEQLKLENRWMWRCAAALPLVSLLLILIHPAVAVIGFILSAVGNYVAFVKKKEKLQTGFYAVRQLAAALQVAEDAQKRLRKTSPLYAQQLADATHKFKKFRKSYGVLVFNDTLDRMQIPDPTVVIQLPILSYGKLINGLGEQRDNILNLYRLIGQMDLAAATNSMTQQMVTTCRPSFNDEQGITAKGLCHLLLDEPVPNDVLLTKDTLFTGSNASGKSTFIKAVAISCIMAQALDVVVADCFTMKKGLVASSMAVADSVVDGDSYFVAEIKSMKRLVQLADGPTYGYYFVDEILKGTNTTERVAAGAAVLQYLHERNCLALAATHDIELTEILRAEYSNMHFEEQVGEDGAVTFDYKLRQGPATSRNAILLLEGMEFPKEITGAARKMAKEADNSI